MILMQLIWERSHSDFKIYGNYVTTVLFNMFKETKKILRQRTIGVFLVGQGLISKHHESHKEREK